MKLLIAATLATLTFGAGAQASHGTDQLASSVGVEPGAYSLPQLVRLKALRSQDDKRFLIDEILDHPEGREGDMKSHHRNALDPDAEGWRNLARSLNVAPGRYTPDQLIALRSARQDDDNDRRGLITSFATSNDNANRPRVSTSTAQLARSVGVEPGLYSVDQLIRLKAYENESENSFRIRTILENPDLG